MAKSLVIAVFVGSAAKEKDNYFNYVLIIDESGVLEERLGIGTLDLRKATRSTVLGTLGKDGKNEKSIRSVDRKSGLYRMDEFRLKTCTATGWFN